MPAGTGVGSSYCSVMPFHTDGLYAGLSAVLSTPSAVPQTQLAAAMSSRRVSCTSSAAVEPVKLRTEKRVTADASSMNATASRV